jgi:hypothetical protein
MYSPNKSIQNKKNNNEFYKIKKNTTNEISLEYLKNDNNKKTNYKYSDHNSTKDNDAFYVKDSQ